MSDPKTHPRTDAVAPPPGKPASAQPSGEEDPGAALDDPVMRDAMREEARRSGTAAPGSPERAKPGTKPAG